MNRLSTVPITSAWLCGLILSACGPITVCTADDGTLIPSLMRLDHPQSGDQDDLCFWYDDEQPANSLVITSDKKAGLIAVYDLMGALKQLVKVPKPGNIDIRQNVDCQGTKRDIVVVNQRTDGWKLVVFEFNRQTRQLDRLDRHDLITGPNYGVCLYHSRKTGELHAVITSEDDQVEQYRLTIDDRRGISQNKVRSWALGKCEGAVADDELGRLYISVEEEGVWELGAEPDLPPPGKLVIRLGAQGLKPDLEGITLVNQTDGKGYLLLSSQGLNRLFAYDRGADHAFLGSIQIDGAEETDGIDVLPRSLGDTFPQGVFGCHTAKGDRPCILLTSWQAIARELSFKP